MAATTGVDTSQRIYVCMHIYYKQMPGKPDHIIPDPILLGYSPEWEHAKEHTVTIMLKACLNCSLKKEECWMDFIKDTITDPEQPIESSSFLMFPMDHNTDSADDTDYSPTAICKLVPDSDKFVVEHYVLDSRKGRGCEKRFKNYRLCGIFIIDEVGSTVFDMVKRTTAADRTLEGSCVDPGMLFDFTGNDDDDRLEKSGTSMIDKKNQDLSP